MAIGRIAAAVARRAARRAAAPPPRLRSSGSSSGGNLTRTQLLISQGIEEMRVSQIREARALAEKTRLMRQDLAASAAAHRDCFAECEKEIGVMTWWILVVFGGFALSAVHMLHPGKKTGAGKSPARGI